MVEKLIDDKDLHVRLAACETAWTIGRSEKAVRAASALLDNPAETVRFYSASLIADMGEGAASAAPQLVDRLSEPNETILICVGKALDNMGRAALEPLLKKTNDPSARVRELAISYLGSMKVADHRITKVVLAAMDDADWGVRDSAVGAVEELKIREPLVTQKLVAILDDPEDMVCEAAVKALATIGAKEAIPSLEKALQARDMPSTQETIIFCLGKLKAVSAIPILEKMLQKAAAQNGDVATDSSVRKAIVTALGHMGPAAIPALERAKSDPNEYVRKAAAESLQRIVSEEKCQPPTSNKYRQTFLRRCHRRSYCQRFTFFRFRCCQRYDYYSCPCCTN